METWKCTSKGKGHLNATYFLCDFKIKYILIKMEIEFYRKKDNMSHC